VEPAIAHRIASPYHAWARNQLLGGISCPYMRDPRLRLTRDQATTSVAGVLSSHPVKWHFVAQSLALDRQVASAISDLGELGGLPAGEREVRAAAS
jgi:hypothetical protein